ncbi:MAG TPA: hypothetical protein VMH34_04235 [Gammaproteobacteria bacterium]|nr:hypothetical protein [Gammaproteobacteria bacterium]
MLLAMSLSPLLMAIVAILVVAIAKARSMSKPKLSVLILMSIVFAIAGAIASLIYTMTWMVWYEKATGYSAGNAPVGWILFSGPLSAALSQLLALLIWWFKKPSNRNVQPKH